MAKIDFEVSKLHGANILTVDFVEDFCFPQTLITWESLNPISTCSREAPTKSLSHIECKFLILVKYIVILYTMDLIFNTRS